MTLSNPGFDINYLINHQWKPTKYNTLTFEIPADPNNITGSRVKIPVAIYEEGDFTELHHFVNDFFNLIHLQGNDTNGPALFQTAVILIKGESRANFIRCKDAIQTALDEGDELETPEIFTLTLEDWITTELPDHLTGNKLRDALLTDDVRKPMSMSFHTFMKRIRTLSAFVPYLSGNAGELDDVDLTAVLLRAVPKAMKTLKEQQRGHSSWSLRDLISYFNSVDGTAFYANVRPVTRDRPRDNFESRQLRNVRRRGHAPRIAPGRRFNDRPPPP